MRIKNEQVSAFVEAANPILKGMEFASNLKEAKAQSIARGKMLLALMLSLKVESRDDSVFDQNVLTMYMVQALDGSEYDLELRRNAHLFIAELEFMGYIEKQTVRFDAKTHTIIKPTELWTEFFKDKKIKEGTRLNLTDNVMDGWKVVRGIKEQSAATREIMEYIAAPKFTLNQPVVDTMAAVLPRMKAQVKALDSVEDRDLIDDLKVEIKEIENILNLANTLEGSEFTFRVFNDSRGRGYTTGDACNIQGSDRQRGVLKPVHAERVHPELEYRFIELAEAYGEIDLDRNLLIQIGEDPIGTYPIWKDADAPWSLVNVAVAFANWVSNPNLPVALNYGLDGKCNGLQHLSAMARSNQITDMLGMEVIPAKHDIYEHVGLSWFKGMSRKDKAIMTLLAKHMGYDSAKNVKFIRKMAKPIVMPYSYGLSAEGASKAIVKFAKKARFFDKESDKSSEAGMTYGDCCHIGRELHKTCTALLGDIVKVMVWFQKSASAIVKATDTMTIDWITPDGFKSRQKYFKLDRIKSEFRKYGKKIRFTHECPALGKNGEPITNPMEHRNGIAPNVTHSIDATHLRMVARRLMALGIQGYFVHDEFQVHINHVDTLYGLIVDCFIELYSDDVLEDIRQQWMEAYGVVLPPVPVVGTWDVDTLRECDKFFG